MRPRGIAAIALLVAWAGVSLVFLSLARPVRTWAGDWSWLYIAASAVHAITASIAAYSLWEMRSWARVAVPGWSTAAILTALLPLFVPAPGLPGTWFVLVGVALLAALLILLNRYIFQTITSPLPLKTRS